MDGELEGPGRFRSLSSDHVEASGGEYSAAFVGNGRRTRSSWSRARRRRHRPPSLLHDSLHHHVLEVAAHLAVRGLHHQYRDYLFHGIDEKVRAVSAAPTEAAGGEKRSAFGVIVDHPHTESVTLTG